LTVTTAGKSSLPAAPVVVTGSRGRLASHLAGALGAAGIEVVKVSREAGEDRISYDELESSGLLDRAAALVHCAWSSLPATAEQSPGSTDTHDLPLLERLLEAAAQRGGDEPLHFVFISSGGAVYGECREPADECATLEPVGWYGRGKVEAEKLLAARASRSAAALCVLRPSNPYGFRHAADKPQGIVGAALNAVRTGEPLKLVGGGASLKDFIHIADFESAVVECLRRRLTGTYNICSGQSVRTLDIIELLEEISGINVPRTDVPAVPWDVHTCLLSRKKFTAATGWIPERDLRRGLREALRDAGFNVPG
jgi:UDP-glucose 4-epimerase